MKFNVITPRTCKQLSRIVKKKKLSKKKEKKEKRFSTLLL